jgi:serine/threonine protein kinase
VDSFAPARCSIALDEGQFVDHPDRNATPAKQDDDDETRLLPSSGAASAKPIAHDDADGPADETESSHALPTGTRLHEFEITGIVGEGGFGIVYLGRDHSLDRVVAIKEYMPSSLAARIKGLTVSVRSSRHVDTFQAGLRSFVNEAKMLAHFDHPSLLKVHRFWEANGTAYMAMPYYRGPTLKAYLQNAAAPPTEAWLRTLLASLLEALKVLHSESCFHRDIAPDNILLVGDDRPVLLDFGAARQVIGDMTQGLTVILKPGYAPIEQYAEVQAMRQGAWTDLYALGATIYCALTGRPPAPAVQRMMSDQLEPLGSLAKGKYSEEFLAAIDAVLRVKPAERPQDVAAFEALLGTPEPPAPATKTASPRPREPRSTSDAPPSSSPRRFKPLPIAVATAAAIGVITFGVVVMRDGTTPQPAASPTATSNATPPTSVSPADSLPATPPVAPMGDAAKPVPEHDAARVDSTVSGTPEPLPKITGTQPTTVEQRAKLPAQEAKAKKDATVSLAPALPPRPVPKPVPAGEVTEPSSSAVTDLITRANQSLAQREYRQAAVLAERVLGIEQGHKRAAEILRLAREGERKAFDDIKIE